MMPVNQKRAKKAAALSDSPFISTLIATLPDYTVDAMRNVIQVVAHTFQIGYEINKYRVVFRVAFPVFHTSDMIGD